MKKRSELNPSQASQISSVRAVQKLRRSTILPAKNASINSMKQIGQRNMRASPRNRISSQELSYYQSSQSHMSGLLGMQKNYSQEELSFPQGYTLNGAKHSILSRQNGVTESYSGGNLVNKEIQLKIIKNRGHLLQQNIFTGGSGQDPQKVHTVPAVMVNGRSFRQSQKKFSSKQAKKLQETVGTQSESPYQSHQIQDQQRRQIIQLNQQPGNNTNHGKFAARAPHIHFFLLHVD